MPFRVLMVCTGNICRSPTAEAVLRHHLAAAGLGDAVLVDSAGTHDYHCGDPPSPPAVRGAAARGYDLGPLRARQLRPEDFDDFDLILAMDRGHLRRLERLRPETSASRIRLFLDLPALSGAEVPDPYYGTDADYEAMLDLIEGAMPALIDSLRRNHIAPL